MWLPPLTGLPSCASAPGGRSDRTRASISDARCVTDRRRSFFAGEKLGNECGVFGTGEALLEDVEDANGIQRPEGGRIEPKTRKELRAEDTIRAGLKKLIPGWRELVPNELALDRYGDEIILDAHAFVELLFGAEVASAAGGSDFDDEFGSTCRIVAL